MQYTLAGFTTDKAFRLYSFLCTDDEKHRTEYRVKCDLGLIQRYGIHVQDLPLLCQGLLERRVEGSTERTFTFTEAEMRQQAAVRTAKAEEAAKNKPVRKPPPPTAAVGWRDRFRPTGPVAH